MSVKRKILVVDDEPTIREMLKTILERADYEVILAEDGLTAVEKATAERPDLVISDGLLPKLHGFLACKAIKKLKPAPKVILLTGIYTKLSYKWEAKSQYEADDLLVKPTRPADLLACIARHIADLPAVDPSVPDQPLTPSEHSSFVSRMLGTDNRNGAPVRAAGYSASWQPNLPSKRLVPSS